MKRIFLFATVLLLAVSCVDKKYDLGNGVDWTMTLLPGMTLDQSGESVIPVDSLFALKGCGNVIEDMLGDYVFVMPDMGLVHGSFTDEELQHGVDIGKSYVIKTPVDKPQILDEDYSDFILENLCLLFTFSNPSPYDLEVRARVNLGDQACDVSFIAVHELTQCYDAVCDIQMSSLPTEIEISDIRLCSVQQLTVAPSIYVLDMAVQPMVPLSFAGGSVLNCSFMSFVFADMFKFDGHVMEFNYNASNPCPFDMKLIFHVPEQYGMEISMDEIPAWADKQPVKMTVRCKGSVKDCKENIIVELQAQNSSALYSTLNSTSPLKLTLKNVYFPEGVIIK